MSSKPDLKLKLVGHKHALYACRNWHYSRAVPAGKKLVVGVFEDNEFMGVIIFSRGANKYIGSPYGLDQTECIELTRIAMRGHKTPLTKILSEALKILKRTNPGIRLVVSYADTDQGHHGGIYQASNWIYVGDTQPERYFLVGGKKMHPKTIHSKGVKQSLEAIRRHIDANARVIITPIKHKYLYPLDRKMRKKIMKLAKPYPKPDKAKMKCMK